MSIWDSRALDSVLEEGEHSLLLFPMSGGNNRKAVQIE